MAHLLKLESVVAGYVPDVPILQGLDFVVETGELVAVIGPNGAGKSTLAKTVFGLLTPNEGTILFKGENITGLPSDQIVRRGMGYVPQVSNVFGNLTVAENLEMGAFLHSGSASALKNRIYNMFPKLAQRRNQKAGTLSGGERQMLAMGRALMLDPDLLLLDEPSAALSPLLVKDVFEQIKAINATGKAIILVEQNAKQALMMADRGYVLESGQDKLVGTGQDLLNNPQVGELYLGAAYQG